MIVSRVDMNILDSPASTIFTANSEGATYDIRLFLLFRGRLRQPVIFAVQSICQRRCEAGHEKAQDCGYRLYRDACTMGICSLISQYDIFEWPASGPGGWRAGLAGAA